MDREPDRQRLGGDFARHDARVPRSDRPADLLEGLPVPADGHRHRPRPEVPVQVDAHRDGPIQRRACGGLHQGRNHLGPGTDHAPAADRDLLGRGAGNRRKGAGQPAQRRSVPVGGHPHALHLRQNRQEKHPLGVDRRRPDARGDRLLRNPGPQGGGVRLPARKARRPEPAQHLPVHDDPQRRRHLRNAAQPRTHLDARQRDRDHDRRQRRRFGPLGPGQRPQTQHDLLRPGTGQVLLRLQPDVLCLRQRGLVALRPGERPRPAVHRGPPIPC